MRSILLMIFGIFSLPAFGDCALTYNEGFVHRYESSDIESGKKYVACKDHPTIPHASIWAAASQQEDLKDAQDENFDLYVALKDTTNDKVIAHEFFSAKLPNGGGPRLSGITLDTGTYFLSPRLRAFGIRASLGMSFTSSEELSLFVVKGKNIVNVLSGVPMHIYFTNRGSACQEQTREARRVIVIDKTLTNGFYDLLIREKLIDSEGQQDQSGDCDLVPIDTNTREYRLKYDGKEYIIPDEMKYFDCRVC